MLALRESTPSIRTVAVTMLTGKVMWPYWLSLWVRVLIRVESQLLKSNGQEYQDVTNDLESGDLDAMRFM